MSESIVPINFKKWIQENLHLMKPPIGNRVVWSDREFIVMVICGPNLRTDYHINISEEFFYQIEGDIILQVMEKGRPKNIPIQAGEIFLLPPKVPHSPQRPVGSLGLVIERRRQPNELDGFVWYCQNCHAKLYDEFLHISDIVNQLPGVFERYYREENGTCRRCGTKAKKL
jgi:3-hydroxyanthranilate 3,4-dioxygenase